MSAALPDPCPEGAAFASSSGMKATMAIQSLTCLAAIITNAHFIMTGFKSIYFHHNIKTIILFGLLNNIIHSFLLMILQSVHLTLYCVARAPCDVYVSVPFCLLFRGPISVFGINNIPLGVAFLIERLIATVKLKTYEKERSLAGLWLGIGATFVGAAMVVLSQKDTPFSGSSAYCSAVNALTASSITTWSYIQVAAEILSILAFMLIWLVNYRAQKRKSYNVRVTYQIRENLAAFKLLFPWMLLHLFCFLSFHTANAIIPLVDSWSGMSKRIAYAQAIPIYGLFSPFLLAGIVRQQKMERGQILKRLSNTKADAEAYDTYLTKSAMKLPTVLFIFLLSAALIEAKRKAPGSSSDSSSSEEARSRPTGSPRPSSTPSFSPFPFSGSTGVPSLPLATFPPNAFGRFFNRLF